jgi:hypothetical protein
VPFGIGNEQHQQHQAADLDPEGGGRRRHREGAFAAHEQREQVQDADGRAQEQPRLRGGERPRAAAQRLSDHAPQVQIRLRAILRDARVRQPAVVAGDRLPAELQLAELRRAVARVQQLHLRVRGLGLRLMTTSWSRLRQAPAGEPVGDLLERLIRVQPTEILTDHPARPARISVARRRLQVRATASRVAGVSVS